MAYQNTLLLIPIFFAVFRYGSVISFQPVLIESKNTSWQRAEEDCKAYTFTLLSATG